MPVWASVTLAMLPLFSMILGGIVWNVSRIARLQGQVEVLIQVFTLPNGKRNSRRRAK